MVWILTESLGEESDTAVGDEVVRPLPVVDLLEVAVGLEGFDDHLDLQVGDILNVLVLGQVAVFAHYNDTLTQEVRVNCSLLCSANKNHVSVSYFSVVILFNNKTQPSPHTPSNSKSRLPQNSVSIYLYTI